MTNQLVPQQFGAVSSVFAGKTLDNDLSANVAAGFGILGLRGKVWQIRYRGEERQLMREDGDGPRNSVEVVIIKGSPHISKIWYEKGYEPGANAAPDCFSTNGITPDVGAQKKQSPVCATCPKNAWGSRISEAGKPGKACSDSRRVAVSPMNDLRNEVFGGPMLLRVPAASLTVLAQFDEVMRKMGYPYNSIAIRIGFDPAEAFPKLQFSPIRPLTDDEARTVLELAETPNVSRILAEGTEVVAVTQQPVFEQPPQSAPQPTAFIAPQPASAPAVVQPAPVQVAPQPSPTVVQPASASAPASSGFGPMTSAGATTQAAPQQTPNLVQPASAPAPASSGFGPMAAPPAQAAAPAQPDETAGTGTPFEANLDAALDNLMGTGNK